MESRGGSELHPLERRALTGRRPDGLEMTDAWYEHFFPTTPPDINNDEMHAIERGEPYCFLCGKPASAFPEYDDLIDPCWDRPTRAQAVESEEGTYNPDTNRFACDGCYIRIGMPSSPNGWKAP